jgi:uncharacterized protein YdaU (DUF1376 family)
MGAEARGPLMAAFPALPLWTDAYLADCGHLSDAEHGRYLLLLMAMWRAPECRLPNDDQFLARRFNRSGDDIRAQFRPLIVEFCQSDGNWIRQKRLTRERAYVRARSKKQSDVAKSRWNNGKGLYHGNAQRGIAPTPTPTPTPTPRRKKESTDAESPDARPASRVCPGGLPDSKDAAMKLQLQFEEFWQAHPGRGPHSNPKVAAQKKFEAAVKRGTDPAIIILGARNFRTASALAGTEPRYIVQAVTWLAQERWNEYQQAPEPPRLRAGMI